MSGSFACFTDADAEVGPQPEPHSVQPALSPGLPDRVMLLPSQPWQDVGKPWSHPQSLVGREGSSS